MFLREGQPNCWIPFVFIVCLLLYGVGELYKLTPLFKRDIKGVRLILSCIVSIVSVESNSNGNGLLLWTA